MSRICMQAELRDTSDSPVPIMMSSSTDPVMGFYSKEKRWHHRHCLLPRDAACLVLPLQKLMDLSQNG